MGLKFEFKLDGWVSCCLPHSRGKWHGLCRLLFGCANAQASATEMAYYARLTLVVLAVLHRAAATATADAAVLSQQFL